MNKCLQVAKNVFILCVLSFLAASPAWCESASVLNLKAKEALGTLYSQVPGSRGLVGRARGVLVFPGVIKGGFGLGGEYGEGVLKIGGNTDSYYNTASASIGLQIGAQKKMVFILFMTDKALNRFMNSTGWKAGVDGSVALIEKGFGDSLDTAELNQPILGFIIGQKGLMLNLTLEGTKISRIVK